MQTKTKSFNENYYNGKYFVQFLKLQTFKDQRQLVTRNQVKLFPKKFKKILTWC